MTGQRDRTTRLAPSPTGSLHLGNAMSFAIAWLLARKHGWRVVMRIEDLDTPRVKPGAAEQACEVLHWLGLEWDGEALVQSDDLTPYRVALDRLRETDAIYPSGVSRRDLLAAASAPQEGDGGEARFTSALRPSLEERRQLANQTPLLADDGQAWRLVVGEEPVRFTDQFCGNQTIDVSSEVGDFIVASKAGVPSYQLSVVIDDDRQGVTDIVRGRDLLSSTARQRLLRERLGLTDELTYWHTPLVRGDDGRRLAKRHGDSRVSSYLERGVGPERILGLLGYWLGAQRTRRPMTIDALLEQFDPAALPTCDITFTNADQDFLLS